MLPVVLHVAFIDWRSRSKLCVQSSGKDPNRSPVGIVSGIVDELIVEGERCPFVEAVGVIGFEEFLGAIVELTIADQNPQPPAAKYARAIGERPSISPATPTLSSGRPQALPFNTAPNERLSSQSVQPMISTRPGLQLARENIPSSLVI